MRPVFFYVFTFLLLFSFSVCPIEAQSSDLIQRDKHKLIERQRKELDQLKKKHQKELDRHRKREEEHKTRQQEAYAREREMEKINYYKKMQARQQREFQQQQKKLEIEMSRHGRR